MENGLRKHLGAEDNEGVKDNYMGALKYGT
jgi:hypothetical protein